MLKPQRSGLNSKRAKKEGKGGGPGVTLLLHPATCWVYAPPPRPHKPSQPQSQNRLHGLLVLSTSI